MSPDTIFLVGPRYTHHSGHSGYESFGQYCATYLKSPVKNRFLAGRLGSFWKLGDIGWRIDETVTKLTPRPLYSYGILAIELATGLHMLTHRHSLYHVLYGDTDVWLLRHIRKLTRNRIVASFHEPPESLKWLAVNKIASELDAVILVSECQRSFFEGLLPPERIFVVPHGVDSDFFSPAPAVAEDPICITVGAHLRDFDTFSQAIDLVLAKMPNTRFLAIGARRKGGGNHQLTHPRVEYHDGISDEELRRLYRAARAGVFSLYHATANNAILEAMACGLPIVANDVGGVREFVPDDAGLLVPPYAPGAFADAILQILTRKDLALRMGAASRRAAVAFDYRRIARRMSEVYSTVLHRDPARPDHEVPVAGGV